MLAGTRRITIMCAARTDKRSIPLTPIVVDAHILIKEVFALHRRVSDINESGTPSFDKGVWVMTHIPTGLATLKGFRTIKQAKAIAAILIAHRVSWAFTDPLSVPPVDRTALYKLVNEVKETYGLWR